MDENQDELDPRSDEVAEDDVEVVEPPKLDINITRTVSTKIDAKVKLDDKRELRVKSLVKGIKLTVAKKVADYYRESTVTEAMTIQDDEAEFIIEALQAVVDARKASE